MRCNEYQKKYIKRHNSHGSIGFFSLASIIDCIYIKKDRVLKSQKNQKQ